MTTIPVLVGSRPNGTERGITRGTRARLYVPPRAWLLERLDHYGLSHTLGDRGDGSFVHVPKWSYKEDGVKILGVVELLPGSVNRSEWNEEGWLQWDYFMHPTDGYTVIAARHAACKTPQVTYSLSEKIDPSNPDAAYTPQAWDGRRSIGYGGRLISNARLVNGSTIGEVFGKDLKVLMLPEPIAELAIRGSWKEILLLARWHGKHFKNERLVPGYPLERWLKEAKPERCHQPYLPVDNIGFLRNQRIDLESLRPTLVAACIPEESLDMFDTAVHTFRSLEVNLQPPLATCLETRRGGIQFKAINMLYFLLCGANVRDLHNLKKTIAYAVNAIIPKDLQQLAKLRPEDLSNRTPSYSSLQRYQLIADTAYMKCKQDMPLETASYWTADGSPQGGKDWLLISRSNIDDEQMPAAWNAIKGLVDNPITGSPSN